VGFAFTTSTSFKLYKLPPEASIFSAESQAIREALTYPNTITTNKILLINDSLSALIALKSPNSSNEIIQQIHNILAKSKKTIQFM
jgi:hypothetical protein